VLRRTKAAVLDDLPPRTEVQLDVELSPAERSLYEALRQRALEDLSGVGQKATPLQVLAWLTRLRLACCHPRLAVAEAANLEGSKLHAFQRLKDKRDLADQLLDGTGGSAALSTSELIEVLRGG
jgi:SNF2 family DNA or RNA helicase